MERDDDESNASEVDEARSVQSDEGSDFEEEECEEEDVAEISSDESDNNILKKLNLLEIDNPYKELDQRRDDIYRRLRAKMKAGPKTIVDKAEEKKDGIERQLEDSEKRLNSMIHFGDEMISNIKVASERRQYLHRELESKYKGKLVEDVEKENIEAMAKFDDIMSRWSELGVMNEPVELYEKFEEQKKRIAELLESKDNMIKQCQAEIDRINTNFEIDQERQSQDLSCLVERIDAQLEIMNAAYKTHLNMLVDTIENERQKNDIIAKNKWDKFYKAVTEGVEQKFDAVKEKENMYADEIARITEKQADITRATRIRLEKDAEMLEWELRNAKHNILLNSEKLEYNYQVLQKRNEEDIIINNQQKRRVAKISENISALKKRIEATAIVHEVTIRKLMADVEKLHFSITDLESKAAKFCQNNRKNFDKVWSMCFVEVKTLITKVIEIDRILHEQQLLIPYKAPYIDLSDINSPDDDEANRSSTSSRASAAIHPPSVETTVRPSKMQSIVNELKNKEEKAQNVRLLRNILRRIADRAGFLVEEKLMKLIEPYREDQSCLVKVDSIFNALRINDMKSVKSLVKFFEPYSYCPNCEGQVAPELLERVYTVKDHLIDRKSLTLQKTLSDERLSAEMERAKLRHRTTCPNHELVVEPTLALTALNDFTIFLTRKHKNQKFVGNAKDVNPSLDNDAIQKFWSKFLDYMPREKRKLWETLEHGLNHYLEVLKQREALDKECNFLRRQNFELKHLFQKYKI